MQRLKRHLKQRDRTTSMYDIRLADFPRVVTRGADLLDELSMEAKRLRHEDTDEEEEDQFGDSFTEIVNSLVEQARERSVKYSQVRERLGVDAVLTTSAESTLQFPPSEELDNLRIAIEAGQQAVHEIESEVAQLRPGLAVLGRTLEQVERRLAFVEDDKQFNNLCNRFGGSNLTEVSEAVLQDMELLKAGAVFQLSDLTPERITLKLVPSQDKELFSVLPVRVKELRVSFVSRLVEVVATIDKLDKKLRRSFRAEVLSGLPMLKEAFAMDGRVWRLARLVSF
ncbi:MAG: uncharacterized protein KVP18_003780 [Porospora cf. gigantea A]|uniref:uncharacterized protein n=1 Tax=Porospora cf. gigantea A TaxID=2853593 RepID=UPI0035597891|nr:MAG: hypothetical protein KVP18_003780 [Porospora cf. gigantea A]